MKVMVVDDEADVRLLFEQRFRREVRAGRIAFYFALSGEEALTLLDQVVGDVSLILSDINMPVMDGAATEPSGRARPTRPKPSTRKRPRTAAGLPSK